MKLPKVVRIRASDGLVFCHVPTDKRLKKLKRLVLATAKLAEIERRKEEQDGNID